MAKKELLTVQEVAAELGITVRGVQGAVTGGRLVCRFPGSRSGAKAAFLWKDVEAYKNRSETRGAPGVKNPAKGAARRKTAPKKPAKPASKAKTAPKPAAKKARKPGWGASAKKAGR